MIDFDALVLAPATDIFAIAATITPLVSQPGAPAYPARVVYTSQKLEVLMQDDTIFADQETRIDIRFNDFLVTPPIRGDQIEMTEPSHPSFGNVYWIGDSHPDGQGGAKLLLRTQQDGPS